MGPDIDTFFKAPHQLVVEAAKQPLETKYDCQKLDPISPTLQT